MAVVALDNSFVWANDAYCRLVGYPLAKLQTLKWMDITVSEDVAADLASVEQIKEGRISRYSMTKRYRHSLGEERPCEIIAWRFPPMGAGAEITGFVCEAIPHPTSQREIDRLHEQCQQRCITLIERIDKLEKNRQMAKRNHDSQVVNVGNNSNEVIKIVVAAVIVLIGAVAYLTYIAGWPHHGGDAQPPSQIERGVDK